MADGGNYVYCAHGLMKISVTSFSPTTGVQTPLQEVVLREDDFEGPLPSEFPSLAVSPDRRFLFASNRVAPFTIRSFAIDGASGLLTYLGDAPAVDSSPFLYVDRTGRFLLAAYNPSPLPRDGYVSVSAINNGFVQPPHQVIHTPAKTHSIMIDPSNRFAFTAAAEGDVITRFEFDAATGLLNPDRFSPICVRNGSNPRHVRFHPNNRFMYVDSEGDGTIYAYSFDQRDGAVSEIQVISAWPADLHLEARAHLGELHLTPDGKWLYVAVRAASMMAAFGVDGVSGGLNLVGHFPVDEVPRGFNIDPFGHYLISNGLRTSKSTTWRIEQATGELTKVAECATLDQPNWNEIVRLP